MGGSKNRQRTRTKDTPTSVEAGKGVPSMVAQSLRTLPKPPAGRRSTISSVDTSTLPINRNVTRRSTVLERLGVIGNLSRMSQSTGKHRSLTIDHTGIAELAARLDLDEYEFPDDEELLHDPSSATDGVRLDVTALDRYNDDVRKLRKFLIDECRAFPEKGEPDEATAAKIRGTVRGLCRSSFFGTHKAQVLAEGTVILIVWLLNKKNVNSIFKVHLLQSFAEMVWSSEELKFSLYRCNGMKVLVKLLVKGVLQRSDQARWATYTLAMACVGCKEIIDSVQQVPGLEEVVGEVAFHAYWANWPANFGQILQGILFGPHSVIPVEDAYQFL